MTDKELSTRYRETRSKRIRMMFKASDMRFKRHTPKWVIDMIKYLGLRPAL